MIANQYLVTEDKYAWATNVPTWMHTAIHGGRIKVVDDSPHPRERFVVQTAHGWGSAYIGDLIVLNTDNSLHVNYARKSSNEGTTEVAVTEQMIDAAHKAEFKFYSEGAEHWNERVECSTRPALIDIIVAAVNTAIEQRILQEVKKPVDQEQAADMYAEDVINVLNALHLQRRTDGSVETHTVWQSIGGMTAERFHKCLSLLRVCGLVKASPELGRALVRPRDW